MTKLSDGKVIVYDWHAITQKEWRALIDKNTDEETNDIIVGKLIGLTADELSDINPIDYRAIAMGMWESYKSEIDTGTSKNSAGASTVD